MEDGRKISRNNTEDTDKIRKGNIGDLPINYGHGIIKEDLLLAAKDKNAVEFVQNYSKRWCRCLKDVIFSLEKRAMYENECMRVNAKLFQGLESSILSNAGAPLADENLRFSRMIVSHAKQIELHNTKRCRELIEVMNRQRTEFEKTRKFLKNKWKADVKRMVEAESALFKAKSNYFNRCQAGVKLREELGCAQASLDESQAALVATATGPPSPAAMTTTQPQLGAIASTNSSGNSASPDVGGSSETDLPPPVDQAFVNAVSKQKTKVERLEKQLGDNDKKEIETMYFYRESVDVANTKLVDLEKSKVEIICDTRLTVTKCEEVLSDSMAELVSHLVVTRTKMLSLYEDIAARFQNYMPGSPYQELLQKHVENGTDVVLEKYLFEGYHDNPANAKDRGDATFGKFVSRFAQLHSKDNSETADGRHSESDSDGEETSSTQQSGTTMLSSIVQFGSSLFRPDLKKASLRSKGRLGAAMPTEPLHPAFLAAIEAAAEREYDNACFALIQCISGLEMQNEGIQTEGIYRVPGSKVKIASVLESIRVAMESGFAPIDLSEEYPITLASSIKTRLIELPEPLLTYNLYDQFVTIGKALDGATSATIDEQLKKLQSLIDQLSEANKRVAGLLFHHLKRVSIHESENQMGSANLATMFSPTVLRQKPKFNVANMMELVDNNYLKKVVEICIERVSDLFGPAADYSMEKLLNSIEERTCEPDHNGHVIAQAPVEILSAPIPSMITNRESFFEGNEALSPSSRPPIVLKHSSETVSLGCGENKSGSSSICDDPVKMQPVVPPPLNDQCSSEKKSSQESSSFETTRGGVSGLKRFLSTKAQSVQQRVQQITAESSGKIAQSTRKLLHAASARGSPSSRRRNPQGSNDTPKGLDVAECSYIDTDSDA